MRKYAIIVAGGSGSRAGSEMPKQFVELLGIPMLWWSVSAFIKADADTSIIIAINPAWRTHWENLQKSLSEKFNIRDITLVNGGKSRAESVRNALSLIPDQEDILVAVHDAARPIISPEVITRGWATAAERDAAIPVVPVTDSLRSVSSDGDSRAVNRENYKVVQTPQIFKAGLLHEAYRIPDKPEYTDDASRVDALGIGIALYEGDVNNFKVTNPHDFALAETILNTRLKSQ
ncbi:MAG: 2-C-methyl-D-erythritol 4-phosphate cytidylyltransferase [Muribaculaceae bacterium]|nr:2-C-methyl-D-erythritol 4-phosphate cytidylyltransferase [Muribaculaceae bacterium]